jgi:hypothetical protein
VYADWLDERGRPGGAYLRAECRLAAVPVTDPRHADLQAELRASGIGIDLAWLAAVSRAPIENCRVAFGFRCPKQWEQLTPTADESIRFCEACRQQVFFCSTIEVAQTHATLGECIAIDTRLARRPGDLETVAWGPAVTMGYPAPEVWPTPPEKDDDPRRTARRPR